MGERPTVVGGMGGNNNSTGDAVNAMSMNDLFNMLHSTNNKLEKVESWIQDQVIMIKPITDKCRGMEQQ